MVLELAYFCAETKAGVLKDSDEDQTGISLGNIIIVDAEDALKQQKVFVFSHISRRIREMDCGTTFCIRK